MPLRIDLTEIDAKIQLMKQTVEELGQIGQDFPALTRNLVRIQASVKMLEINVCDIVDLANND